MAIVRIEGEKEKSMGVHYEVDFDQDPIGFGGMGTVMKGERVESNGVRIAVAIKFLFEDLPQNAVDRARREASIQLQNDNLVKMYGFVEIIDGDKHRLHVVSEFLDGIMLHDFLKGVIVNSKGETVPFFERLYNQFCENKAKFAIYLIKNILSGIMALHDAGYIHRDIDPSNIMLTTDGKIKLIDFGVARNISSMAKNDNRQLTVAGNFIGKASYAAPELAMGDIQHQNQSTDIYAIGILLYQILTGELPFNGPLYEVLEKQIREPLPLNNIQDNGLRRVIATATQKNQQMRYHSAAEFRVALEKLEYAMEQASKQPKAVQAAPSTGFFYKLATMSSGMIFLLMLILGVALGLLAYFIVSI